MLIVVTYDIVLNKHMLIVIITFGIILNNVDLHSRLQWYEAAATFIIAIMQMYG